MGIESGHPNLEALLAHLDGDGAAFIAAHVARCPACARECRRLASVRARLNELEPEPVPGAAWDGVSARLSAHASPPRPWPLAAAAGLLVAVGAALWLGAAPVARDPHVVELVARSQALEQLLAQSEGRAQVMDMRTAAVVARLQDQIGAIDETLTLAAGRDARLSERLWVRRVELMQGLAELQARPVAYREY